MPIIIIYLPPLQLFCLTPLDFLVLFRLLFYRQRHHPSTELLDLKGNPKHTVIPHFSYIQIMLYSAELKRGTA